MKNKICHHWPLLTIFLLTTAGGIFYFFNKPQLYLSKSQIAIFRPKVENPDETTEESRNRWVWIRDGLNQKSAIITDLVIAKIINSNKMIRDMATRDSDLKKTTDRINKLINIQYTGADENNFIVEVKAIDPQIAFDINNIIFERIRYLTVTSYQDNFEAILSDLKKRQLEFKDDLGNTTFYQNNIRKLIFNHSIEQTQREKAFVVIQNPQFNKIPIESHAKSIIVVIAFIGAFLGSFLEYAIVTFKEKHE